MRPPRSRRPSRTPWHTRVPRSTGCRCSRRTSGQWWSRERIVADRSIYVSANSGAVCEVLSGEVVTVRASTIVDFVAFDLHDRDHRFDQARTKANQGKIYVSTGDVLISKRNVEMLRIVLDEFTEGTHDLQYGTCSPVDGDGQWSTESRRRPISSTAKCRWPTSRTTVVSTISPRHWPATRSNPRTSPAHSTSSSTWPSTPRPARCGTRACARRRPPVCS
ncbi:MAG: DUF1989 domain-containing protein [Propionibacteriales bacterium]|nr:DUF1989 domain-containing protein [Propionibacteriales bacterium]